MAGQIVPTLLVAALGMGLFLRLVAKEKHRREQHLQFRLDEQIRKAQEEEELERQKAEEAKQKAEGGDAAGPEGEDATVPEVQAISQPV